MILIAGPCVIESQEQLEIIATDLKKYHKSEQIDFYFKASFDKANRTSLDSYRGPGLEKGLEMLAKIKEDFGYKILTDVHESYQVPRVAEVADVIQIPAFLCRQTDLLVAAAKTKKIVNIKKGQFMHPEDMKYSVLKVLKTRGIETADYESSKKAGIWLTERGTTFGYRNLVVDMRSLVIMREFAPVIFDATHAVQMPGGAGGKSSGNKEFVAPLSRAAAAVGVDGFFFETHYDPTCALSDGPNMVTPSELEAIVEDIFKIKTVLEEKK
ncbi:3-deoxy-8-phosphooctulonate synthase [Nitratiruptor tergarcus]|uniref:2-dehydro-3-deoxyphosphooctonate aldolase n=1 Tax=Nitratiruptor tergarcus DSM 16512 TaxID=1069081 RepID=A0A1W1WVA1_9BACT|nr:3-deoxy-8-phosphooctulonate synthase [Nitratiruptor tergarcus]SMC10112.1 2-dehydro-3-deoxyphosphooctonate aldolase (KDO 8-P synthase) [Nitratiruptor tergarcus DSM 16512]